MSQRKILFIALALMLAVMMALSACSTTNKSGQGTNTPSAVASQSNSPSATNTGKDPVDKQAELEPYEVSIVYFGTPEADVALVEEKLNEFFKERINATVKLMPIAASDYQNRTELMMNTGEKMDLVFTASWLNYFGNVTKGAFLELDELLEQHGQGIKDTIHPLYLEAPRLKGKLYAVPTNKEITQGQSFTYRQDIVDKYEIPIETINKWADLELWYEKISKEEPGLINLYLNGGSGNSAGNIHMSTETNSNYRPVGPTPGKTQMFFVDYTSSDVKVKTLLDPELVEINKSDFELFRKYYEKGYINADAATSKTNPADLRRQGKLWMSSGVWKPGSDIETKIADNNQFDYVSHVVTEPIVTTDLATGSMFSISRTSENPERAMMVLNYLHTDPYAVNLIVHGIEGKHYKKVGENRIEPIADSGYGASALFWVIGSQMLNYLKPGQPDDLYINWQKFNEEAVRFPLMGFVFDDTNVKNEISQLTGIVAEYKSLATGAVPNPSKLLDERNAKLKSGGIERVQEELQAQIDAWLADNK